MSSIPISSKPQFGIAWQLTVSTFPDSQGNQNIITAMSLDFQTEGLEIQFEIYQSTSSAFWYADIAIFGLNSPTTNTVLKQGMEVRLDAGFQKGKGPYGTIFQGLLMQPLWERVNGIDYKVTLHCIIGLVEQTNNIASFNVASGITQRDFVSQMAQRCTNPLTIEDILGTDTKVKSSRGETVFGQPGLYLETIAGENLNNFWISNQGINIRNLIGQDPNQQVPTLVYSPTSGLVGTPRQTQDGVVLRVLLDPRALVATQIQLQPNVAIVQLPRTQNTYPTILDQQGLYVIGAVSHIGDSRGNTWFSELTCYTYVGSRLALLNPR